MIPRNCRLAHDIRRAIEIAETCASQLELVEPIWNAFCHYDPFYTNNNAALLFAGDDFEPGITTTVLEGWDTDCHGATIGSILGSKLGAWNIPARWKAPLNDSLYAKIPGLHRIAISECARRNQAIWKKLRNEG